LPEKPPVKCHETINGPQKQQDFNLLRANGENNFLRLYSALQQWGLNTPARRRRMEGFRGFGVPDAVSVRAHAAHAP
jgi:hypothetical protein